ncbi:NAD(P)-binding protein [Auricularia subglabra TFB-10046 SS5]|nr:NAD(P)-binding protein [Auricularia subglabra TFB-10046 SS5]
MVLPTRTKALVLRESAKPTKPVYHDARLETLSIRTLELGEVLVRVHAVSFNRRDWWIRRNLYPAVALGTTLGSDFAGVVVASADPSDELVGRRVFGVPFRGWEDARDGPEGFFAVIGGVISPSFPGAFAQYLVVDRKEVIESCQHLDDEHMAAWPPAGVTAWRAAIVHGNVRPGQNVLITGIGGGVALVALQLCVAIGANVWVTSGDDKKIQVAIQNGAKGGVVYKDADWPAQLASKLGDDALLDVVIDSAGGDICGQTRNILKHGAVIVCYGMTAVPSIQFTMREVMKNIQLKGSLMGSHKELKDATHFISKHKIVPVVSDVIDGLENAEQGFEVLAKGSQVGKVVIRVRHNDARI